MAAKNTLFKSAQQEIFEQLQKLPETDDYLNTYTETVTKSHKAPFKATTVKDAERLLAYAKSYSATTTFLVNNLTAHANDAILVERRKADSNEVVSSVRLTYAEIQAGFATLGNEFDFGKKNNPSNDVLYMNGIQMANSTLSYFTRECVVRGVLPFNRHDVNLAFRKTFGEAFGVGTDDVYVADSFVNDIICRAGNVLKPVYKKKYGTDDSENKLKDKSFNRIVKDVFAEFGYEDITDDFYGILMFKMGVQSVYMNNRDTNAYPTLHTNAVKNFSVKKKINNKYVTILPSVTSYGAYVPCLDELTKEECLEMAESELFKKVYAISHERFNSTINDIVVKSESNNVYLPGCELTTNATIDGYYNATLKISKGLPYIIKEGQNPLTLYLKLTYINKDEWKFADNVAPMLMFNEHVTVSNLIEKYGEKNYLGLAYTVEEVKYMVKPNVNPSGKHSMGIDTNLCDFLMVCSRKLKFAVDVYWYIRKFYEYRPDDMMFVRNPELVEYMNATDRKEFTTGLVTLGLRYTEPTTTYFDTFAHFWPYAERLAKKERPDDAWYFGSCRVSRLILISLILLDDKYSSLHHKYDIEHPDSEIPFANTEEAIAIKKERVPLLKNLERHTNRFLTKQFLRPAIKEGIKCIYMEDLSITGIKQASSFTHVRSSVAEYAKTRFGKTFISHVKGFKDNVLSIELKPDYNIDENFNAVKLALETECKYDDCWNFVSMEVQGNILAVTYEMSEQGKNNKRRVHVENVIKKALHVDSISDMLRDIAIQSRYSVPVFDVNPKFTSQRCSNCGEIVKNNRDGRHYKCSTCGFEMNADENASINIDYVGRYAMAILSTLKYMKSKKQEENANA